MSATIKPDHATIDRARALRATGMTFKQIAAILDTTGPTVSGWCGRGTGNAETRRAVPPGYETWVETFLEAPKGQPVVYHEMNLEKAGEDQRDRSAFLAAWNLCQQGVVTLTQKRVEGRIHYRATRIR